MTLVNKVTYALCGKYRPHSSPSLCLCINPIYSILIRLLCLMHVFTYPHPPPPAHYSCLLCTFCGFIKCIPQSTVTQPSRNRKDSKIRKPTSETMLLPLKSLCLNCSLFQNMVIIQTSASQGLWTWKSTWKCFKLWETGVAGIINIKDECQAQLIYFLVRGVDIILRTCKSTIVFPRLSWWLCFPLSGQPVGWMSSENVFNEL